MIESSSLSENPATEAVTSASELLRHWDQMKTPATIRTPTMPMTRNFPLTPRAFWSLAP
jgi:hypothetical protein